jgi:hypothetical protein
MSEIALARINTFASAAQQADVQPSEPIFVLTGSQLQEIISLAVQESTQSLETDIQAHAREIQALKRELGFQTLRIDDSFEAIGDIDNTLAKQTKSQPLQKDRAKVLKALLAANGGKMLAKEARKLMHLPKNIFSELLKTCDFIEPRPYHLDKRQLLLVVK